MALARTAALPMPGGPRPGVGRRTMLASAGAVGVAGVATAGAAAGAAIGTPSLPPPAAAVPVAAGVGAVAALASQIVKVTVQVNKAALVGQLHAYLANPAGASAPVMRELTRNPQLGLPMPIVEALVMEGDLSPAQVEQFVDGMFGTRQEVVFY